MKRLLLPVLGYLVPTFALGFLWHLVWFKEYYDRLAMYRGDVIIPFGFLAMTIQAVLFAWTLDGLFAPRVPSVSRRALVFAIFGAVLSWTYTTLSVAAKNVMSSVPGYLLIESAFTLAQWILAGPLMTLAHAYVQGKKFRGGNDAPTR